MSALYVTQFFTAEDINKRLLFRSHDYSSWIIYRVNNCALKGSEVDWITAAFPWNISVLKICIFYECFKWIGKWCRFVNILRVLETDIYRFTSSLTLWSFNWGQIFIGPNSTYLVYWSPILALLFDLESIWRSNTFRSFTEISHHTHYKKTDILLEQLKGPIIAIPLYGRS